MQVNQCQFCVLKPPQKSGPSVLLGSLQLYFLKILVVTPAYVRKDSGGGGGKSQGNPTGDGECHLFFWAGNRAVLLGNRVFLGGKSHDYRRF